MGVLIDSYAREDVTRLLGRSLSGRVSEAERDVDLLRRTLVFLRLPRGLAVGTATLRTPVNWGNDKRIMFISSDSTITIEDVLHRPSVIDFRNPGAAKAWVERCHNDGVTTYCDEKEDKEGILGESNAGGLVRVYTEGIDAGAGGGTREKSGLRIHGTLQALDDISHTHMFYMREDGGGYVRWLVQQVGAAQAPVYECGT